MQMHLSEERRQVIRDRVRYWAKRLSVDPKLVRIQHMTRKWASCSTSGVLTFAIDLADQESGFRDFAIVHELLHLRIPNHGKLFKALMTVHVPNWKEYDRHRHDVSYVPKT